MKKLFGKILRAVLLTVTLTGLGLVLTAGVFSDEVKLKNVSKPFVDLDAMVEDMSPGHGGNAVTGIEDAVSTVPDSDERSADNVDLVISVRETGITVNGDAVEDADLEKVIDAVYKQGMQVVVIDDYADFHTFTSVKKLLDKKDLLYSETQK